MTTVALSDSAPPNRGGQKFNQVATLLQHNRKLLLGITDELCGTKIGVGKIKEKIELHKRAENRNQIQSLLARQKELELHIQALTNEVEEMGKRPARGTGEISASPRRQESSIGFGNAADNARNVHRRNFLKGISNFETLTDDQLTEITFHLKEEVFSAGDVIIREGDTGTEFFIVEMGKVCVRKRSKDGDSDDLGEVVANYSAGSYFGERALLTSENRMASVVAISETVRCLTLSKKVFIQMIAKPENLLDFRSSGDPDGTLASLTEHVTLYADILKRYENAKTEAERKSDRMVLKLTCAFAPELGGEGIIERIMKIAYTACHADRVGLFVVDRINNALVLKVSRDARGVSLPMSGIAGLVAKTGKTTRIDDAYKHPDFNPAYDRESKYRTRSMICVPIFDKKSSVIAVLQVINRKHEDGSEGIATFSAEDEDLLEDIAIHVGNALSQRSDELEMIDGPHFIPVWSIDSPYRVCVHSIKGLRLDSDKGQISSPRRVASTRLRSFSRSSKEESYFVSVSLYHGQTRASASRTSESRGSKGAKGATSAFWHEEWIELGVNVCKVPEGSRLILRLHRSSRPQETVAWAGVSVGTFDGHLRRGNVELNLWQGECASETSMKMEPRANASAGCLSICIVESHASNHRPFIYKDRRQKVMRYSSKKFAATGGPILAELEAIGRTHPLYELSSEEKNLLWSNRMLASRLSTLLPKFLKSIDWFSSLHVTEAHRLLHIWEHCEPHVALQLLAPSFADRRVRAYAVSCLESLSDRALDGFLLELVQTLKGECFNDSALIRFLLRRALEKPLSIGYRLFWLLKAEMDDPDVRERFGTYLELFVNSVPAEVKLSMGLQNFLLSRFTTLSANLMRISSQGGARTKKLREELRNIAFPKKFHLPISSETVFEHVVVEKCRCMSSKKAPLWLTLRTDAGKCLPVLFKSGDDLRQDQITIQLLMLFDSLWRAEGMDMRFRTYSVVPTSADTGFIEVVPSSSTLAGIIRQSSGKSSGKISNALKVVFSQSVILKHLKRKFTQRLDGSAADNFDVVIENFTRSCAAYCVATFILGIGDRHNDNIMVSDDGYLFHIDYGHFLGNFKSKYGIKRERAPFLLVPSMAYVIKSKKKFGEFVNLCQRAFNVLRKHASLLISLFVLMINAGLPELQNSDDLQWLLDALMLDKSDEEASRAFKKLIKQSLSSTTTKLNHAVHMLR